MGVIWFPYQNWHHQLTNAGKVQPHNCLLRNCIRDNRLCTFCVLCRCNNSSIFLNNLHDNQVALGYFNFLPATKSWPTARNSDVEGTLGSLGYLGTDFWTHAVCYYPKVNFFLIHSNKTTTYTKLFLRYRTEYYYMFRSPTDQQQGINPKHCCIKQINHFFTQLTWCKTVK